jgi:type III pantothenate kinase
MQAGVFFGYIGLVDSILGRIKEELSGDPLVIATGGYATMIARGFNGFDRIEPDLTLHGLRLFYEGLH